MIQMNQYHIKITRKVETRENPMLGNNQDCCKPMTTMTLLLLNQN